MTTSNRRRSSRLSAATDQKSESPPSQKSTTTTNHNTTTRKKSSLSNGSNSHEHDEIEIEQKKLSDIFERHDDRVRLLFHLENFVSLVNYDPKSAKEDHSNVFEEYRQQYDLWSKVTDSKRGGSRRSTRRQIKEQQHNLLNEEEEKEKQAEEERKRIENEKAKKAPAKPSGATSNLSRSKSHQPKNSRRKSSRGKIDRKRKSTSVEEEEEQQIESPYISDGDGSIKPSVITHPAHVVVSKYGGLENYLDSFVSLDEDVSIDERDKYISDQIVIRDKIQHAKDHGLVKEEDFSKNKILEQQRFKDPIKRDTHGDFLVGHATHFSKLLNDERKSHISKAKKIASMVDQHFKRLEGAEEKEKKLQQKKLKQLAKKTAQDVMKRWKLAEKVVQQRRAAAIEHEQRKKGKLQLNQILEQSAQLLESRMDNKELSESEMDKEMAEEEEENGSEVEVDQNLEEDLDNEEDSDDDSALDSDNMSSEEEEDDDEEKKNEDLQDKDDANLSVEELRQKYAHLEKMKVDEKEDENNLSEVNTNGRIKELDEDGNEKEELSDESIPMDSEGDISSSEEEESAEEAEEANQPARESSELASLMNGHSEDKMKDVDEDDVEYTNKEEDEPKSTGEEEEEERFKIKTAVPPLIHGNLREYQHYGLEWLAGLYKTNTNGILADEMGLGKTIQTIALIAYLACEKHIWGPHLIVVPTSVMLNWEMEFKRFAPGLKVMTYYGNPQQRKEKRRGWNKENVWHVCITSYQLVLQDQPAFKRKKWKYMILDEAHNIKNFRSQRWQALLNFNSERRLLLTGTPLQNNLVELWSLLYFLMPSTTNNSGIMPDGFANLKDFQDWFARPVDKLVEEGGQANDDETKATVSKLHQVLRPYLLRRLKADVEKQLPAKYEHVVNCKLSKRQRYLYDDFMSRAQTKETLASGNFLSIINCLMQLRKVCNHPDLFEVRPIVTSLAVEKSIPGRYHDKEIQDLFVRRRLLLEYDEDKRVNLDVLGLLRTNEEMTQNSYHADSIMTLNGQKPIWNELKKLRTKCYNHPAKPNFVNMDKHSKYMEYRKDISKGGHLEHLLYLNQFRCSKRPVYGKNLIELIRGGGPVEDLNNDPLLKKKANWDELPLDSMKSLVYNYDDRDYQMKEVISKYSFVTPPVACLDMTKLHVGENFQNQFLYGNEKCAQITKQKETFHESQVKLSIAFPDKRLLQYDCGKLQRMALLLRDLIDNGHRALIFTQMTKVLDVLEKFLNIHGFRYLRLDGATKIEQRQVLTERFNTDTRIPIFILSTRSGGLGINLTGADTVIFYDSDWNPSMDKQCQDRCHRIGQTRDVHIYRFVSEYTIESNILRKATQKQILDNVVIQEGEFTTDYFNKLSVKDMIGDTVNSIEGGDQSLDELSTNNGKKKSFERALAEAEDDQDDVMAANVAMKEANVDREDFDEQQQQQQQQQKQPHQREGSSATTARTTAEPESQQEVTTTTTPGGAGDDAAMTSTAPEASGEEEDDDDDEMGHIDDYMIRFIESGYFE